MDNFWDVFLKISVVVLMFSLLCAQFMPYLFIWKAAKRLKLRDKGMVQAFMDNGTLKGWMHSFCNTRFRIGINKEGQAVQYCWRCEFISPEPYGSDPKGRDSIPSIEKTSSEIKESTVLPFRNRNIA